MTMVLLPVGYVGRLIEIAVPQISLLKEQLISYWENTKNK